MKELETAKQNKKAEQKIERRVNRKYQKDLSIYHETSQLVGKQYYALIIISLVLGFVIPLAIFFIAFDGRISTDIADWGNFGLFMEGIAGPFFSFASFFGLILTLNQSIREKKDDDAQELFFRYIDSITAQSEQAAKDASALKTLYNRMLRPEKYAGGLPSRQELRDVQQKNMNFMLLIYAVISFIRSNKKLDNQTYISILFSYLTFDEKYVFCVDMARGRADHAVPVKLQQLIVSSFMNYPDFAAQLDVIRGGVRA
jgi:hypothetical protein